MIKSNENTYKFTINNNQDIEVFIGNTTIEIYDETDPSNSGFVFDSMNDFVYFCNCITDVIEEKQKGK